MEYKLVKRNKYIEEYDGDKLVNIWRIMKKHLCILDSREGFNFKICYCLDAKTYKTDRWFKITYLNEYEYKIEVCDEVKTGKNITGKLFI